MEQQKRLFEEQRNIFKPVIALQSNKLILEHEKESFINNLCYFIEPLNFEQMQDILEKMIMHCVKRMELIMFLLILRAMLH